MINAWASARQKKNEPGSAGTALIVRSREGGAFILRLATQWRGWPRMGAGCNPDHAACAWRAA